MKTHIAIQHFGGSRPFFHAKSDRALWTTFILASLGGLLFGILLTSKTIVLPTVSPLEQLADVSGSKIPLGYTAALATIATSTTNESEDGTIGSVAGVSTEEVVPTPRVRDEQAITDVNILINDIELTIIRINNEIELIKNSSVTLVADFDRNCGNWKDVCGAPYATELEKNNTRYDALVAKLAQTERDRESALQSRSSLMSE